MGVAKACRECGAERGDSRHAGTCSNAKPRMTPEERKNLQKEAVALYKDGKSIRDIADDLGYSYGTVHGILKQRVKLRPWGGYKRKLKPDGGNNNN